MRVDKEELVKMIEEVLEEQDDFIPKIQNRGDVAEGLLGAAIVARYLKGGDPVDIADVESVLDNLAGTAAIPMKSKKGKEAKGKIKKTWKSGTIKRNDDTEDEIEFTVALPEAAFQSLVDPTRRPRLQGTPTPDKPGDKPVKQPNIYGSVVKYANAAVALKASVDEMNDQKSSLVTILSDGVSDQKGTKVDLYVYKTTDGKKEYLERLGKLSLKALGTKQIGQIGKTWACTRAEDTDECLNSRGIYDLMKQMFGITLSDELAAEYKQGLAPGSTKEEGKAVVTKVFQEALPLIQAKYAKDAPDEVVEFKKGLARAIKYEVQLKEEGVILVHLENDDYKELDFNTIEDKIGEVDIEVEGKLTGGVPYLYVIDAAHKLRLLNIRPKIRAGEVKIYIEKEKGLVELLKISEEESSEEETGRSDLGGHFASALGSGVFKEQKHLTNPPLTAKMLQEMIDDLLSKE